ncbi:MAG: LCP family protein [Clostridiales bacterium]|nr:LCP family protein [Clostridiales bacterium]
MSGSDNMILSGRKLPGKKFGVILAIVQAVLTFTFLGFSLYLNVLPGKFLIPIIIILLSLLGITFYTQFSAKGLKTGRVLAIIMCLLLGLGCFYLIKAQSVLDDISGVNTRIDDVSIIVLADDPAQTIADAADYTFGISEDMDRENTDKTIEKINSELDSTIKVQAFDDMDSQIEALYDGGVGAIILNEAYRETIKEIHNDFDKETRVLSGYKIETPVDIEASSKNVVKESFNVYISGIDTYGSIRTTSRSDVNIVATVNPNTKHILLTTTPRDYYVPFPNSGGMRDKLTHAGVYGIDVSIGAIEDLYGIDIDYYARVNFDSLIKMVDALGGIEVVSAHAFKAGGYNFDKGVNKLDGEKALAFSRERKSFAAGDNQRGKNQMAVIKGMIDKAMSPAIITNYNGIMDGIAGSFETNMGSNDITGLVKMQIDNMSPWKIESNAVTGKGAMKTTYTYKKRPLYVAIPNEDSVEEAKNKIRQVMEE